MIIFGGTYVVAGSDTAVPAMSALVLRISLLFVSSLCERKNEQQKMIKYRRE